MRLGAVKNNLTRLCDFSVAGGSTRTRSRLRCCLLPPLPGPRLESTCPQPRPPSLHFTFQHTHLAHSTLSLSITMARSSRGSRPAAAPRAAPAQSRSNTTAAAPQQARGAAPAAQAPAAGVGGGMFANVSPQPDTVSLAEGEGGGRRREKGGVELELTDDSFLPFSSLLLRLLDGLHRRWSCRRFYHGSRSLQHVSFPSRPAH